MFIPSAVWRGERAGCLIVCACDLLKTPLTPEQLGAVRQILFQSAQLFLDARANIGPLAKAASFGGDRTPLNDHDTSEHMEKAKELTKRLLQAPPDCAKILQEAWP